MRRFDSPPSLMAFVLYPGVICGAMLTAVALSTLIPEALATGTSVLMWSVGVVIYEHLAPAVGDWHESVRVKAQDLVHTVLWHALAPSLLRATVLGATVAFAPKYGFDLWPTSWPPLVQALLALFVGEFFAYWIHRFGHESALGWRIHSLHHSTEKMHAIAAGRNHPFNVIPSYLAQVTPLLLMGVPAKVLVLHAVFTGVNGPLQHTNLRFRTGFLSWVFATPELHFWHHSRIAEESNHNYGSNVIIWDVLFGTRWLPGKDVLPQNTGLVVEPPRTFREQLLWPFSPRVLDEPQPEALSAPPPEIDPDAAQHARAA